MWRKIIILLVIVFIGLQFIRPAANNGPVATATDIKHYVQVPENIDRMLVAACYDCHSNRTNYPWYAYINPVGLWLNHHIQEGKAELNFSDLSGLDPKKLDHKLEEIAEEVQEGHMPLPSYLWLHPEARLNQQQVNQVTAWVNQERQRLKVSK